MKCFVVLLSVALWGVSWAKPAMKIDPITGSDHGEREMSINEEDPCESGRNLQKCSEVKMLRRKRNMFDFNKMIPHFSISDTSDTPDMSEIPNFPNFPGMPSISDIPKIPGMIMGSVQQQPSQSKENEDPCEGEKDNHKCKEIKMIRNRRNTFDFNAMIPKFPVVNIDNLPEFPNFPGVPDMSDFPKFPAMVMGSSQQQQLKSAENKPCEGKCQETKLKRERRYTFDFNKMIPTFSMPSIPDMSDIPKIPAMVMGNIQPQQLKSTENKPCEGKCQETKLKRERRNMFDFNKMIPSFSMPSIPNMSDIPKIPAMVMGNIQPQQLKSTENKPCEGKCQETKLKRERRNMFDFNKMIPSFSMPSIPDMSDISKIPAMVMGNIQPQQLKSTENKPCEGKCQETKLKRERRNMFDFNKMIPSFSMPSIPNMSDIPKIPAMVMENIQPQQLKSTENKPCEGKCQETKLKRERRNMFDFDGMIPSFSMPSIPNMSDLPNMIGFPKMFDSPKTSQPTTTAIPSGPKTSKTAPTSQ